jgi:hypothetical protein
LEPAESSLETSRQRIEQERQALTTVIHCMGIEVRSLRRRVEELERERDSAVQQAQGVEQEARRLFRTWDTERQALEAQWHKTRKTQIAELEQRLEAGRQQSAEERRALDEQLDALCREAAELTRQRDAALQQVQSVQQELLQFCRTWDTEREALQAQLRSLEQEQEQLRQEDEAARESSTQERHALQSEVAQLRQEVEFRRRWWEAPLKGTEVIWRKRGANVRAVSPSQGAVAAHILPPGQTAARILPSPSNTATGAFLFIVVTGLSLFATLVVWALWYAP